MSEKQLNELPLGWVIATLSELGTIVGGGTPSTREPQFWRGDVAWITPADLSNHKGKFISKGARNITQLGLEYSSATLLPKGSVIFSSRAPIGYVAITQNELATSQGFKSIIPTSSLCVEYMYYYLQSARELAISMASGTTFLELSTTNFSKIPIPIPPKKEQLRIVEKIEELFSELEKAEEIINDTKQKLEICRSSVIEQILFGANSNGDNVHIGEIVNRISIKVYPSTSSGLKFVGLNSIEPKELKISQIFDFKNYASSGNYFEKGHILYSRMRPYLNKVTKADFDGAASGEYIVLECKENILNSYLMYVLHSGTFVNYANQKSIGDRPRLSFEDLAVFQFHLKNIQEQKQAVNDIERYFTIIDNLRETLKETENQIATLRQSVLKKAFEGRLISPLEPNESAIELLELIRKEKLQYSKNQQEIAKNSPKKQKVMEEKKSILEILQSTDSPLRTEDVWLQSAQKENIEEFYAELKKIQNQIVATKKNTESFLSLKK